MKIIAYTDPMTAQAGDDVAVKVSARDDYRAELVRLSHGDRNCDGPGFKAVRVESAADGSYPGSIQPIHTGSCVVVAPAESLQFGGPFTLAAWICSMTPAAGVQGVLTNWDAAHSTGYALVIDADGGVALRVGGGENVDGVATGVALRAGQWYFVAGVFDGHALRVLQQPDSNWPHEATGADRRVDIGGPPAPADVQFVIAGYPDYAPGATVQQVFNGRIEAPVAYASALGDDELAALRTQGHRAVAAAPVAAWDFARDFATDIVTDTTHNALHGRTVNAPTRALLGHRWDREEVNFAHAPAQYSAIHFHDDDLEDAGWQTCFDFTIPETLASGVYAFHLSAGDTDDYIPFFVRPPSGRATAPVALLIPTLSYLAYANEDFRPSDLDLAPHQHADISRERYDFVRANRLLSLYSRHADGSGVCYASRLRPIPDLRPDHRHGSIACPHNLGADLYFVDWMEAKGIDHDIITDEALYAEGVALLSQYKVIMTGSHPEYWSVEMLDALEAYLDAGGHLMYLGGNGLYWVTSFAPGRPHLIEVRRGEGVRSWEAAPGELYHSTTGQRGGLWRSRDRAPQRLTGVGFTAQGFDFCRPYRRNEAGFDPRAAFIFEGIGDAELIGDFPSLVLERGAAGFEIDRADGALGTPPHALVVASSFGHSNAYQLTVEEVRASNSKQGGRVEPRVRADMVFFETPNNGAVFSVGSIAWGGSLSYNDYDNNVSRVTQNVLRRFVSDAPFA